jgi:hypothetical protein
LFFCMARHGFFFLGHVSGECVAERSAQEEWLGRALRRGHECECRGQKQRQKLVLLIQIGDTQVPACALPGPTDKTERSQRRGARPGPADEGWASGSSMCLRLSPCCLPVALERKGGVRKGKGEELQPYEAASSHLSS